MGNEGPRERGRDGGISDLRETERTDTQREGWEAVLKDGIVGSDQMNSVVGAVGDGCGRGSRSLDVRKVRPGMEGSPPHTDLLREMAGVGTGIQGSW